MATDGGVKPLQNAMKMAKVAIQLDGGSRHKEAYCEYLRTINFISHALLEEAGSQKDREMVSVEVERMLTLAEQCLERAKSFVEKTPDPADTFASCSADQSRPRQTAELPVVAAATNTGSKPTSPVKSGHRRVMSDGGGDLAPFLPPEVFHKLQTVQSLDTNRKELTPIEQASRQNQKLKANYEARLARLTPGQAYQKTSLIEKMFRRRELRFYWRKLTTFLKKLSLQRQMMENLIIAKARQDALQRKMEERRLRLQEEANRRFAASGAMPPEEQEQRTLYTNVLEYEQDHDWPKVFKAKMKENPDDVSLVTHLVSYLLSQSDHPVVKLLKKHQYRVYNKLYPIVSKGSRRSPAAPLRPSRSTHDFLHTETQNNPISGSAGVSPSRDPDVAAAAEVEEPGVQAAVDRENSFEDLEQFLTQLDWTPPDGCPDDADAVAVVSEAMLNEEQTQEMEMRALREHLKAIVKDIHIAIDQLLSLCLLSFECLNTATSKDLCLAYIEEAFFTPLWAALVALYRTVNREREQAFEKSMKLHQNASPADVGVPSKLLPRDPDKSQASYPYDSAVQELMLLVKDCCPQRKLECIVRTLRVICACAEDYRCLQDLDSPPKTAAIGADDLLPILSFVALRCQCPQLVSECAALEEFIHEGYLIGEEGYCLTSMQSALAYVESLNSGGTHPSEKLV